MARATNPVLKVQLLAAWVFAFTVVTASGTAFTYDVYPTCHIHSGSHCLTLSNISDNSSQYFTSNSTLVFHCGDHLLQGKSIYVAGVDYLTLTSSFDNTCGQSLPRVFCLKSAFWFFDVTGLEINSIHFTSCNFELSLTSAVVRDNTFEKSMSIYGGAIASCNGSVVDLSGVNTFVSNIASMAGGAVFCDNSTLTFSGNTTFRQNKAGGIGGGGIAVTQRSYVAFTGLSTFIQNSAEYSVEGEDESITQFCAKGVLQLTSHSVCNWKATGGGILVLNSELKVEGESLFESNSAVIAGSLGVYDSSIVSFSGNTTFLGNWADKGGAVGLCAMNSISFNTSTVFEKNSATAEDGGALSSVYLNSISFIGNNDFTENRAEVGGAVSAHEQNIVSFSGNTFFTGNVINDRNISFYGGSAVLGYEQNTLNFSGNSTFHSNSAVHGAAVSCILDNIMSFNGNNHFVNNFGVGVYLDEDDINVIFYGNKTYQLNWGGALQIVTGNKVHFKGNNSFVGNNGRFGGAVFSYNSSLEFSGKTLFLDSAATENGGAIMLYSSNLSFNGQTVFTRNLAPSANMIPRLDSSGGGALYAHTTSSIHFHGNSYFEGNTRNAILGNEVINMTFRGRSRFVNHSDRAIEIGVQSCIIFSGDNDFINNSGGSMRISNSIVELNGNNNFVGNTAGLGGAIFLFNRGIVTMTGKTLFENNTAENNGGAIMLYATNISFYGNTTFMRNVVLSPTTRTSLQSGGGAIYAGTTSFGKSDISFHGKSYFEGNRANLGFGGVILGDRDINMSFSGDTLFTSNTAAKGGGVTVLERCNIAFSGLSSFISNSAKSGGVLYAGGLSTITFSGDNEFINNSASVVGGSLAIQDSSVELVGNILLSSNYANYGGGIFIQTGSIMLKGNGILERNYAIQEGYGGAIYSISSTVVFDGDYQILDNMADNGGGLAFSGLGDRKLFLKPGTNMTITGNLAHRRGGALYVEDNPITFCMRDEKSDSLRELCFLQVVEEDCTPNDLDTAGTCNWMYLNTSLTIVDNIAVESGDAIYGGQLDSCAVCCDQDHKDPVNFVLGTTALHRIAIGNDTEQFPGISSEPYQVCICNGTHAASLWRNGSKRYCLPRSEFDGSGNGCRTIPRHSSSNNPCRATRDAALR